MINLKTIFGLSSFVSTTDNLLNLDMFFSVDNRSLTSDNIFIAIVGERYNPLEHLDIVVESGCRFVVYERSSENDELAAPYQNKLVLIRVNEIEAFIAEAGKAVANTFKARGGKIIAISGSNGKTTTKEMLTHILRDSIGNESIAATQKNNNNHLGVPFTLFQIKSSTKVAIVELGSNHPGEIEHLCQIIKPQFGVTTNIGDTHLEFFRTRENVFREEACLAKYCTTAFFKNNDDELLQKLEDEEKFLTYGTNGKDYRFNLDGEYSINGNKIKNENIMGDHNYINLMLSMSIASVVTGRDLSSFSQSASTFLPTTNRSQWIVKDRLHIFLDAYNANPSSMKAALGEFLRYVSAKKVETTDVCVILGDMNELGKDAAKYHEEFGETIDAHLIHKIIFVGKFAAAYSKSYKGEYLEAESVEASKNDILNIMSKHKYIFIKGSRSLQLESILDIR